jgi:AraC-like DNA-binding protein
MKQGAISVVCLVWIMSTPLHAMEDDNPFTGMTGKPYASYIEQLYDLEHKVSQERADEWQQIIAQLHSAGKTDFQLELEAKLFEIKYRQEVGAQPFDNTARELTKLAALAGKKGYTQSHLRILFTLFQNYRSVSLNFERAIHVAEQIVNLSAELSTKDYPLILRYYAEIAEVCWMMGYYDEMMALMNLVTQEPLVAHRVNALALAYCYKGLYYLHKKRYNDAEQMFRTIHHRQYIAGIEMNMDDEWGAIAEGNIGCVLYSQGKYVESIPYLTRGLEGASKGGRGTYAACRFALYLGNIYIHLDSLDLAEHYILLAKSYNRTHHYSRYDMELWILKGEYNFITGQRDKAREAVDSALEASFRYYEEYNPNRRARFQGSLAIEESENRDRYLYLLPAVLLLSIGGYPLLYSYRKKRMAAPSPTQPFVEDEKLIFYRITRYMEDEKPYLQTNFTIKKMSHDLNINRSYLSVVINTKAKCNFRAFVNNYRILAAIDLLEKNKENNLTIEAIADEVGFADRFRFYRVFKEITGSSPMQYLKQRGKAVHQA